MKTIIDNKRIRQRATISNLMSIGGLITLLASVLLPLFVPGVASFSFAMLVIGLGVSMVGIYYANRWVRQPRPEDKLDAALKSLNDSYHLFHYPSLPCDHVLLTPAGVLILETVSIGGVFTYKGGKWKESMTIGRALRFIVEEHLGDPFKATSGAERMIKSQIEQLEIPEAKAPVKSVVVFTHPAVDLEVENPPTPVVKVDKLRKLVPTKSRLLDDADYQRLDEYFSNLTVKA